jgi:transcriptional regulator with XRE-family HTH domain
MRNTTEKLITTRTASGLSRRELARRLGVSAETVRALEHDHRRPTAVEIAAYRVATGMAGAPAKGALLRERVRRLEEENAWLEHLLGRVNGHRNGGGDARA